MGMPHEKQGHQAGECMLVLIHEQFLWDMLLQEVQNWVKTVVDVKLLKVHINIQKHQRDQY